MLLLHTFTRGYIVWWWTQIRESRSLFCRRGWRGPSSDGPRFQGRHFEEKPESEVLNFGRGGSWTPNLRKLSWKLVENVEDVGKKPINRRIGIKKMDFAWNLRDEIQFYSSQKLWLHGGTIQELTRRQLKAAQWLGWRMLTSHREVRWIRQINMFSINIERNIYLIDR